MEKIIENNCTLCKKGFDWHEPVIGKMPENLWFCLPCSEKWEDKKVYKGIDCWFTVEYEKGIVFEYKK